MSKVSAIVFHQTGIPHEVVQVEELAVSLPGPGEARVRLLAAPINPADLNVIEGKYPTRPGQSAVAGVEGVGEVEAIGADVDQVSPGDRVLLPHGVGAWREAGVMAVADLQVVPSEIPVEQAAMLRVNPATALRMMTDFVRLEPGEWILQNAANSGVGLSAIQIARSRGLRTINFVRRPELIEELRHAGGDVVLLDEGDPGEEIRAATEGAPIRLALNAVGGDSALRLATSLARGGTVVTYGAMGRKPLKIPNGLLIFQDQAWRGFWISHWYRTTAAVVRDAMFAELFALARQGILRTPVERIYPLQEAATAVRHAAQSGRSGKILFGAPEIVAQFSRG